VNKTPFKGKKKPVKAKSPRKGPSGSAKSPAKVSEHPPRGVRRLEAISDRPDLIGMQVKCQDSAGKFKGTVVKVSGGIVDIERGDVPEVSRRSTVSYIRLARFERECSDVIDMSCGTFG